MSHRYNLPRVFIAFIISIVLISLVASFLASRYVSNDLRANAIKELHTRAELLSQVLRLGLRAGQPLNIADNLDSKIYSGDHRYTIVDPDGNVIADSHANKNTMDNHGLRPEIFIAQERGFGYSERYSSTLDGDMLYYALLVSEPGFDDFYVRASTSLDVVQNSVSVLKFLVFGVGVLSSLIALLVGYYIFRSFAQELEGISQQADEISRGNYKHRIYTGRPQEVGQLVDAINRLAKNAQWRVNEVSADRNQLAAILSSMIEGVIALDHKQRVLHINAAAEKLLKVNALRVIGRPIWEHVRYPQVQKIVEEVFSSKEEVKSQITLVQDNKEVTADVYATGFINAERKDKAANGEQERLLGAVLVLHDISVQTKLETVRRDFVANASHELKTPLAAIRGLAETIEDDPEMPEELRQSFIKKINKQSQRITLLLSELLDLSKLESSTSDLSMQSFDVSEFSRQTINDMRASAEEKDLTLKFSASDKHIKLLADRVAIEQMVQNLLSNAIKYTQKGSVSLLLSKKDDVLEMVVKDTGEGISGSNQERVFERFYRVDRARSRELGGNGLGLSIVKHIVERHGGTIDLESRIGVGSSFTVRLPMKEASENS